MSTTQAEDKAYRDDGIRSVIGLHRVMNPQEPEPNEEQAGQIWDGMTPDNRSRCMLGYTMVLAKEERED